MITVKFPALNKALSKDLKDLPENDPRRGVIILNNNAIVLRNDFCLVCNLYDYFTIECGIEDDFELEELQRIMFYMEEKIFSNEYWSELTKGANMKIENGVLFIENPKYSKDLYYKEVPVNLLEPLAALEKISIQPENLISAISIPFGPLNTIYSCLASEFKNDKIIFEFSSQEKAVKFTFKNRKHFYGYILPDYDAVQEGFRFDTLESFIGEVSDLIKDLKEAQKTSIQAPSPPVEESEEQEEENPSQLKIATN